MTVHQLSVFIENKSGALVRVLRLLKQENIQLIASTIADTADFGICRIICSQPEKAYDVLREAGVAVSLCEVFAIELDDRPGMAADAIEPAPPHVMPSEHIMDESALTFLNVTLRDQLQKLKVRESTSLTSSTVTSGA